MKLIQAARETNEEILGTDMGLPLRRKWKSRKTTAYKKIYRSQKR